MNSGFVNNNKLIVGFFAPQALASALLSIPAFFYLHNALFPTLSLCLNQDCGRNITKRGVIHHQGCPGYEMQARPYQQWVLSCMLDLMLLYLSPKWLHNVWFIVQSCWYSVLTTSLGSHSAAPTMVVLHTSFPHKWPHRSIFFYFCFVFSLPLTLCYELCLYVVDSIKAAY